MELSRDQLKNYREIVMVGCGDFMNLKVCIVFIPKNGVLRANAYFLYKFGMYRS